jgi:hypothetical protein
MATKNKTKKKPTNSKRANAKKMSSAKELEKSRTPKKLTKKKSAPKKAVAKRNVAGEKMIGGKTIGAGKRQTREKRRREDAAAFPQKAQKTDSGDKVGDLQGLPNVEGADSESVDELLEEGNAFEAEVVTGVEDAEDHDEREVRTHEVPEDDVPGEYLDKDE